jgi:hypothetical protein
MSDTAVQATPSLQENRVLQALCLSGVERSATDDACRGTQATLIAKGWIEPATSTLTVLSAFGSPKPANRVTREAGRRADRLQFGKAAGGKAGPHCSGRRTARSRLL